MNLLIVDKDDRAEFTTQTIEFESLLRSFRWNGSTELEISAADAKRYTTELASNKVPQELQIESHKCSILIDAAIILSHISMSLTLNNPKSAVSDWLFDEFHSASIDEPGVVPQLYFITKDLNKNILLCSSLVQKGMLRQLSIFGFDFDFNFNFISFYVPSKRPNANLTEHEQRFLKKIVDAANDRAIRWSNGVR